MQPIRIIQEREVDQYVSITNVKLYIASSVHQPYIESILGCCRLKF
jgi:hypothetical protein